MSSAKRTRHKMGQKGFNRYSLLYSKSVPFMGRYLLNEALSGEDRYMWTHLMIIAELAPDTDVSILCCMFVDSAAALHHCRVVGLRKYLVILLKMSGTLFVQSDHLACSARPEYLKHFSLSIGHLVVLRLKRIDAASSAPR